MNGKLSVEGWGGRSFSSPISSLRVSQSKNLPPHLEAKVSQGLGSRGLGLFLTILPRMPGRMMMKVTSAVRKMVMMTAKVVSIGKLGLGPG